MPRCVGDRPAVLVVVVALLRCALAAHFQDSFGAHHSFRFADDDDMRQRIDEVADRFEKGRRSLT